MGEGLLRVYREKVKRSWKIAFAVTFIIGLLTHIYKFTNTLPNHDSVYNYYSDQNVLGSGRWFLSIACGISSYFDLPWINGLLSIVWIALTVVVIVDLFCVENPIVIALIGGTLAVSPGITETLFFGFTADGYMLAMLLAALAVRLSDFEHIGWRWSVLSALLLCLSCGIYQSYVSFAFVLMAFYFVTELLHGHRTTREAWRFVGKQAIIFVAALMAYYVIWQICMAVQGVSANDYQGIRAIADPSSLTVDPGAWLQGCFMSVYSIVLYYVEWNVLEHGITLYAALNIVFMVALIVGLITAIKKSEICRRKGQLLLVILALVLCVPAAVCWELVSPSVVYRPMMLVCLALLFVFGVILFEEWTSGKLRGFVALLLTVMIFNNALIANISYYYLHKSYEASYASGADIVSMIREEEEDFSGIAIVGSRRDTAADLISVSKESARIHMLGQLLETDLLLDREHVISFLRETYNLEYVFLSKEECDELEQHVHDMPCWPSRDCVQVIDGALVLKLGEITESE